MNTWEITKSLIWKELRESRVVLPALLVLIAVSVPAELLVGNNRFLRLFFSYAPYLLAAVWGVVNGEKQNRAKSLEITHLPVSRVTLWVFSFPLPCTVLACWAAYVSTWHRMLFDGINSGIDPYIIAALFALSYFFASLTFRWIAFSIGVLLTVALSLSNDLANSGFADISGTAAAGAVIASLFFVLLDGRCSVKIRQGISGLLLLAIIIAPLVVESYSSPLPVRSESEQRDLNGPKNHTFDHGAAFVRCSLVGKPDDDRSYNIVEFSYRRTGFHSITRVGARCLAVGAAKGRFVYLLTGTPSVKNVSLIAWDTHTGRQDKIVDFVVWPNFADLDEPRHFASLDPSDRFIIMKMFALNESGKDLWLVDLSRHTAVVVMQDAPVCVPGEARWIENRVLIPSLTARVIDVDLNNAAADAIGQGKEVR